MPSTHTLKPTVIRMHTATPILRVKNLESSVRHYVEVFGFEVDWHDRRIMASVSRGAAAVMLCQGDQGHPGTWVWIGVNDAEALHTEYLARGAAIALPPTNYPWAHEFHVEDPDGHVLRFGSDPKRDRPFTTWVEWYVDR